MKRDFESSVNSASIPSFKGYYYATQLEQNFALCARCVGMEKAMTLHQVFGDVTLLLRGQVDLPDGLAPLLPISFRITNFRQEEQQKSGVVKDISGFDDAYRASLSDALVAINDFAGLRSYYVWNLVKRRVNPMNRTAAGRYLGVSSKRVHDICRAYETRRGLSSLVQPIVPKSAVVHCVAQLFGIAYPERRIA